MRKQTVCTLLLLSLLLCACGKTAPDPVPDPISVSAVEPAAPEEPALSTEPSAEPVADPAPETGEARETVSSAEYSFRAVVFHSAAGCESLAEFGYDYEMYILITRLQDGTVQLYRGVPAELWKQLSAAEDPEVFLREQIDGVYECADYLE